MIHEESQCLLFVVSPSLQVLITLPTVFDHYFITQNTLDIELLHKQWHQKYLHGPVLQDRLPSLYIINIVVVDLQEAAATP